MDQIIPYVMFLGHLLRVFGFLVFGFGAGRFVLEQFKESEWQVQIALILGFFGVFVAVTDFGSPGSAGTFALGAGAAYLMSSMPASASSASKK
jgi:hypothetical protein